MAAALKAISEPHEPRKQAQAGRKPELKFRRPREKIPGFGGGGRGQRPQETFLLLLFRKLPGG